MQKKYLAILMILLALFVLPGEARGSANGLSDLTVTRLEVSQNPAATGDMVKIYFTVENIGRKSVSNCSVELQTKGVIYPFDCSNMEQGASRIYTTAVQYGASGQYNVKVIADPKNLIRERNESNNVRELTLTVKDLPNIGGINFYCLGGTCPNTGYATEGDPVGYGLNFQNSGTVPITGNLKINISMDGISVLSKSENIDVPVGGYFVDGGLIPGLYYTPGIHTLRADLALEGVRESDPSDNYAEFTVEAIPLPPAPILSDPTIGGVSFEWYDTAPDIVKVHYLIDNIGDATSPSADVGISIDGYGYTIRTIGSIPPGGKIEDVFDVPASLIGGSDPSPGMFHTMNFAIDPANSIVEKREDNNNRTEMLCYPPGKNPWCGQLPPNPLLPDLSLSYQSVEQTSLTSIKVNHYLTNNGPGILAQQVKIQYSTDVTGEILVVNKTLVDAFLGPGEQMIVSQEFYSSDIVSPLFPFGYYHMWAEADPENFIPETDENNNILILSVCISNSVSPGCYSPGG